MMGLDGVRLEGKIKTGNAILFCDAEYSSDRHKLRTSEEESRMRGWRAKQISCFTHFSSLRATIE